MVAASRRALLYVWIRLRLDENPDDPTALELYHNTRRIHRASIYRYRRGLGLCGVESCPKPALWPHSKCLDHMCWHWARNAKGYRRW